MCIISIGNSMYIYISITPATCTIEKNKQIDKNHIDARAHGQCTCIVRQQLEHPHANHFYLGICLSFSERVTIFDIIPVKSPLSS